VGERLGPSDRFAIGAGGMIASEIRHAHVLGNELSNRERDGKFLGVRALAAILRCNAMIW
jgi:hypothetical protein